MGVRTPDDQVDGITWNSKYYWMIEMQNELSRFVATRDFNTFRHHAGLFQETWETLCADLYN